jgi:hypothetical protein
MILRGGILALMAVSAMTSAAMADCRIIGGSFRLAQNESVSATGVLSRGKSCMLNFRSHSIAQFTSGSIVSRPGNGTLTQVGALLFRYAPRSGFKGVDRYALRVCGNGSGGPGCATITYSMTVE